MSLYSDCSREVEVVLPPPTSGNNISPSLSDTNILRVSPSTLHPTFTTPLPTLILRWLGPLIVRGKLTGMKSAIIYVS